jgi:SpoVK/Ycf46/Vps4 family AAA+-type ATPase
MPKSLELYANYMNWKLPTYEEIEEIVNNTIKECKLKEINNNEIKAVINSLSGLPHYKIQENMTICMAKYMELKYEFLTELKTKYIIEKSSLEIVPNDITMEQVGGMDNLKDWISKRANAYSEEAKKYGIEPPKGVLLLGFPGCGKSLSAKTIANYLKLPLVKFDISTLFTKALGSSEENARNVTRTLEALEPCVVFIDEIEKALSGLGSSDSSDGGTTARIIGILLTWLNDRKSKNFIVATANDISNLPAPLLRKGRFDEIFFCPFPQGNEREKIFSIHLKKRGQKIDKFNLKALSNMTENYSGAEIEQIVKESMILSFSEKEELSQKYLEKAAKDCIPSYKTYKEEMDMLMDWIGWDDNRNDGIRARFASDEAKKRHGDPNKTVKGTNVISVKVPGSER